MLKLDFAVIGAQKCGTSALYSLLSRHPDIAVSTRKEFHCFDAPPDLWQDTGRWQKSELWHNGNALGLKGDFTPSYMYHPKAVQRLVAINPDIRCIVILRDPIERAFSHWRMQRSRGLEVLSFTDAIRSGRERVANCGPNDPAFFRFSYVERGFFGAQIVNLLKYLPPEKICFLSMQDLWNNQHATLQLISKFLRISPPSKIGPRHKIFSHENGVPIIIDPSDFEYLSDIFVDDTRLATKLVGFDFMKGHYA